MKKSLVIFSLLVVAMVSLFQISDFLISAVEIIPFGYVDYSDAEDIEVDEIHNDDHLSKSFETFIEEHPTPFSKTIVKTEDD
ncbi:hypothetical protein [Streptococcus sp. S784/96/1]|uniref:hypothetical protein n=1 Tax=Streptococcus sp. S784/96/1 TaxID=2653499 RepID=UPI0013870194|nr:hypothetical protein [Streptococcus sp. S784/96/1]